MTTKLKLRVVRLQRDLPARRRAEASAGLLADYDIKEYGTLFRKLYETMPSHHRACVTRELSLKHERYSALRLAAREDGFRMRSPRRVTVPRLRLSRLTLSFIGRLERALRGDRRPLSLPARVCDVYLWAERYKCDGIPLRECEDCGYDTPAPPGVTYTAALSIMDGASHAVPTHSTFSISSCPLCRGTLAPEGERPWSDENQDDVVDIHVWPDGEISVLD
jgi:hypothetical protein